MSDFLGNLAARSIGRSETIQPRVRSLFEPSNRPEPIADEVTDVTAKTGTPVYRGPLIAATQAPPADAPMPRAPQPAFPIQTSSSAADATTAETPDKPAAADTDRRTKSAGSRSESVSDGSEAATGRPAPAQTPKARLKTAEPKPGSGIEQPARIEQPRLIAPASEHPPPPDADTLASTTPRLASAPANVHPLPPDATPVTVGPQRTKPKDPTPIEPLLPLPVFDPLPPPADHGEPTINVTIGRIEVRALPPQDPKPRRNAPVPVLSLDEYLRQRARGER